MGKTNWKYDPSVGEITYPLRVSEKTPFYRYGEEVPSYPDILMYVYLDKLPSLIRHEQVICIHVHSRKPPLSATQGPKFSCFH